MKRFCSMATIMILISLCSYSQSKMIIHKYDGTADSISLSDIKSISFVSNLIKNGDFGTSLDGWSCIGQGVNPYHPADPGRAEFAVVNGVLSVDIKNQGTGEYSIMLYQSVQFEKGATYAVSFDAMADSTMGIISNVTQDVTYKNYSGDKTFQLGTEMSTYSYTFTMTDSGSALFQICLGNFGIHKIYIDNIMIRKA